ncbi:MAG: ribulose-phosphate 3-epimerase [Candidatus Dojkabacteria bacterium]|nr:MAG: ribulose-phosphate 3-epimerase [Candidatus Dojkabacteria bacterium]
MIIAPAIFTNNIDEFKFQLESYTKFAKYVDVDINYPSEIFRGMQTIELDEALSVLTKAKRENVNLSFHLMMDDPQEAIEAVMKSNIKIYKIYIHQESNIQDINIKSNLAITVNVESRLLDLEFYNQFSEVQLMTVTTGNQGNDFMPDVLEKARALREQGFTGLIGIDGGVNDKTAHLIKNYPIDKVSVGSFFSKALDPEENFQLLEKIFKS